ncbi:SipW-cognate class signal peptide [Clostridium amylolyticum]|uniref:SipW-cognate class signal peptide n=1 Tax=Clostridium amylolyticum TaxID=1121298 RepID=A0A1M6GRR4_9CLOT|nr:hypothetical protein [Clostridium amylolyticum]SHJ12589.1 SipW-cognate class signal peptide [Clostridium amylolyticum]
MKKAKALTAAIVAGLITVGAGYAWWTDALTIKNTVNTGDLNVKFTEARVADYSGGYVTSVVKPVQDKLIEFSLENMYPGAQETLYARFDNTGSIPAVVDKVNFTSSFLKGNNVNMIKLDGTIKVYDKNNVVQATYKFNSTANNFGKDLQDIIGGKLRVEPQGYVKFEGMNITLDSNAPDAYEKDTLNMNLGLSFKQHNQ